MQMQSIHRQHSREVVGMKSWIDFNECRSIHGSANLDSTVKNSSEDRWKRLSAWLNDLSGRAGQAALTSRLACLQTIYTLKVELQNHLVWKRSSSPTISVTYQVPPLNYVPYCHVHTPLKYCQGWRCHHSLGQHLPMLDNPPLTEVPLSVQFKLLQWRRTFFGPWTFSACFAFFLFWELL